MNIRILSISDSDKHFGSAIAEYSKRLGKTVELIDIKPVKNGTQIQIIKKETELLLAKITQEKNKGRTVVLLSKEGKLFTTQELNIIFQKHPTLSFVIGGPYGLDEPQLDASVDGKLSLGNHTMPHGLAKLVLLEQIYRVSTLLTGKSYHY